MDRVTIKDLQYVVDRINKQTGSPMTPYTEKDGKFTANPGNYHLDGAYGGWKLDRMCNEGGGVEDVLRCGYCTKRELYRLLHAFADGISPKNGE